MNGFHRCRTTIAAVVLAAATPVAFSEEAPDETSLPIRSEGLFQKQLSEAALADQRGGAALVANDLVSKGTVSDNVAANLTTGTNTITEGSFSNAAGLPMVIQNSGNNVLIQNNTILNLNLR